MVRPFQGWRWAGALMPVALVFVSSAFGASQERKPYTPEDFARKKYSTAANMVEPQLRKSLELVRRAQAIAGGAQSSEELNEAAAITMEAYYLQRASHGGLSKLQRANTKAASTLDMQDRTILASRNNLIGAQNEFKLAKGRDAQRIERGLEYLRTAIKQTQSLLAMRGAGG